MFPPPLPFPLGLAWGARRQHDRAVCDPHRDALGFMAQVECPPLAGGSSTHIDQPPFWRRTSPLEHGSPAG